MKRLAWWELGIWNWGCEFFISVHLNYTQNFSSYFKMNTLRVHYRDQSVIPNPISLRENLTVAVLSQINLIQRVASISLWYISILPSHLRLGLATSSWRQVFPLKLCRPIYILQLSNTCYISRPYYPPSFDHRNNISYLSSWSRYLPRRVLSSTVETLR
jgi:hypothetical protein